MIPVKACSMQHYPIGKKERNPYVPHRISSIIMAHPNNCSAKAGWENGQVRKRAALGPIHLGLSPGSISY